MIGYIYYEAPEEEQNFSTLLEFINASETREEDEEFKNAVDLLFEELERDEPNHFAVRQYKKYKLAAGVVSLKRLLNNRMLVQRFQNNCLIHLPANPIAQLKKPRRSPLRLRFFS